jgi:hypothetical protein
MSISLRLQSQHSSWRRAARLTRDRHRHSDSPKFFRQSQQHASKSLLPNTRFYSNYRIAGKSCQVSASLCASIKCTACRKCTECRPAAKGQLPDIGGFRGRRRLGHHLKRYSAVLVITASAHRRLGRHRKRTSPSWCSPRRRCTLGFDPCKGHSYGKAD